MSSKTQSERDFNTSFAGGTVSCLLSLEGDRAELTPEMLDNCNRTVSKQVYTELIPRLNQLILGLKAVDPGEEKLTEEVVVELLDHKVKLKITVDLSTKLQEPHKQTLRYIVVNLVAAEVVKDIISRFSGRTSNDLEQEYYTENPEAAHGIHEHGIAEILSMPGGAIIGVRGGGAERLI